MRPIVGGDDDTKKHGSNKSAGNACSDAILFILLVPMILSRLNQIGFWVRTHRALSIALLLAISLSLMGANWGRVECWNLDNMAFRGVMPNFLPCVGYLKPPLHIYLNQTLVMKPAEALRSVLGFEHNWQYPLQLWGARLVTLALFCGTIVLIYHVARRNCGPRSAGVLALITATTAGLIMFNHFATADSPLLFWMMASFALALKAARTGRTLDAFYAGLVAGLATADKYNGLGVAIAIPAAIVTLQGWKFLFGKQCWVGAFAVPLGFILGNPGAVFDSKNFVEDFLYNLYTTPVYDGKTAGAGYFDFLTRIPDLIGWPGVVLISIGMMISLYLLFRGRLSRNELALLAATGAVFLFYYVTIGRFPRMADRFVLPVIPFLFLFAAPGFERLCWKQIIPAVTLGVILIYNIFCSVEVGQRFLSDPRMDAQLFALKYFWKGAVIENSNAPDWGRLPGLTVKAPHLPSAGSRASRFTRLFGQNSVIQQGIEKFETSEYPADTFTLEGLKKRNPDFVAFSNQAFQFTDDEQALGFYHALDDGKMGYVKVFDQSWKPRAPWSYPHDIDFLAERMIILKRAEN